MTFAFQDWKSGSAPTKGWDVADCLADGWTVADINALMKEVVCDAPPTFPGADDRETAPAVDAAPVEPPAVFFDVVPPVEQDDRSPVEQMVDDWCFVAGPGVFRHIHTGSEMKSQSFNLTHQRHTPEVDYTVAGRVLKTPKEVPASDWLMNYAKGKWVQDTMYLPQLAGPNPVVWLDGVSYLNAYLPKFVPVAASVWEGHPAVDTWSDHLKNILPDDWELLLTWLAYCAQNPGKKILWAPIVKGTQGDGKTTLSVLIGSVMGRKNVKVVSTESLLSDFTGYAEGSCVAFLEEIRVKGHNRHDAMNKLKPLVTNSVVDVVSKGANGRNVINVTNYMAFTNFEDALVIDANDRRWGVFFTRFQSRADLQSAGIGKAYWDPLYEAAEKHADVLRAWLLAADTSAFDPKAAPPITAAKSAMIANSVSGETAMLQELVSLGRLGVAAHVAATDAVNVAMKQDHGTTLATTRMAAAFAEMGWEQYGQIKWKGKARRLYVDRRFEWPVDETQKRYLMKTMLDETEGGLVGSPLDDVMVAEPVGGVW